MSDNSKTSRRSVLKKTGGTIAGASVIGLGTSSAAADVGSGTTSGSFSIKIPYTTITIPIEYTVHWGTCDFSIEFDIDNGTYTRTVEYGCWESEKSISVDIGVAELSLTTIRDLDDSCIEIDAEACAYHFTGSSCTSVNEGACE